MARKAITYVNKVYDKLLSLGVSTVVSNARLKEYIFPNKKRRGGEKGWVKKWSVLGTPNKKWYRLFAHYIGDNIDIVPDDIMSNVIEPILNPVRFRSLYEDKCLLDNFFMTQFSERITPVTILRNINGVYFTEDFDAIDSHMVEDMFRQSKLQRLITKASIDENSGRGIYFWERNGNHYIVKGGEDVLSVDVLSNYYPNGNYIIQEVAEQSDWMNHLCPTSVNTLRIHMYRSVKDEKPHLVNAVVRIGRNGSLVDNAHAGGSWCGIRKDGSLLDYVIDQHAYKRTVFNGVDFSKEKLIVPNWSEIEKFSEKVMLALPHMRNLALDVMIDKNGKPKIIEYNTDKFSTFFYQLTTSAVFAEYTDEVIEYCCKHMKDATRIYVTF